MAAISLATPTAATPEATSSQPISGKGRAFVSTLSDAAEKAAKPVEAKSPRSGSKAKDDRDDRQDDKSQPATATAAPVPHAASAAVHGRDDKATDGKDAAPRAAAASAAPSAGQSADGDDGAIDTSETDVDTAALAPVLDALKQAASAAQQAPVDGPAPASQPEAPVVPAGDASAAVPLPATAALLAARVVPATAQQADAKAATPAKKSARADVADDTITSTDSSSATPAPGIEQKATTTGDSLAVAQPSAGQQLAAGGADRALDVAKQGAWLDGLARDIAVTGDSSSTLRFQAAPTHLGSVQVEIARGLEGAAVTLTASSEGARSALADARPQLIAEARAQGIHIASAQVDVSTDSHPSGSGSQPDQRHDPRSQTSLSSQTGGEGSPNRQSQTRSQPFAINQTSESQPVATAEADDSATSSAPAGGMYA